MVMPGPNIFLVFRNMHFPNTTSFDPIGPRVLIFIFANKNIYQSIRAESIWQFICILGDTGHILSYFWLRGNYTGSIAMHGTIVTWCQYQLHKLQLTRILLTSDQYPNSVIRAIFGINLLGIINLLALKFVCCN